MALLVCGRGAGLLRPALDDACRGLQLGEAREFVVRPEDPAHPAPRRDEALVVVLPASGVSLRVGQTVRINYQGQPRPATVTALDAEKGTAQCDMNDPLAGKVLYMRAVLEGFEADASAELDRSRFPDPSHVPDRVFDLEGLAEFDGQRRPLVYLSVRGFVYDVTSGGQFYGPGGPYGHMAGRDATVALARFSLDPRWLNTQWAGLDEEQRSTLAGYVRTFQAKYQCVGKLRQGLP